MASIISVTDLRKEYYMENDVKVIALGGVTFEVEEGQYVVTMGPSGSGKSTLMNIIGGLDRPTSGSVIVNGYNVTKLDDKQMAVYRRTTIGFVFQSFNLIPTMTALENVALPMRLNGVGKKERAERARDLLVSVGLEKRIFHTPNQLSGGQQQRIAVARALANDPKILLADEPTGNLDSASGDNIMQILINLNTSGKTIFIVTHEPRMAPFGDRLIKMFDGNIQTSELQTKIKEVPHAKS